MNIYINSAAAGALPALVLDGILSRLVSYLGLYTIVNELN